jgi:HPt (histidine-containing phosphotransfer) domain-containing protein
MAPRSTPAIVSALADHPDYEERLQAFVLALGERIDACQDAEAAGDLGGLLRLTELLAGEAKTLGYAPLERAALRLGAACDEGTQDNVRKATEELTFTANRVRKGHRGSI